MRNGKVWIGVVAVAGAVMLPVLTNARQEVVHVVIPLKHVPATRVQRLLTDGLVRGTQQKPEPLRIDGMNYMAADTVRGAVLAVGTENAIHELREIVALLDVPNPVLTVDMRILRSVRQDDGSLKTQVVAKPSVKTLDNQEASVSIGDGAKPGMIGITRAMPNEQAGYFLEVTVREEPKAR